MRWNKWMYSLVYVFVFIDDPFSALEKCSCELLHDRVGISYKLTLFRKTMLWVFTFLRISWCWHELNTHAFVSMLLRNNATSICSGLYSYEIRFRVHALSMWAGWIVRCIFLYAHMDCSGIVLWRIAQGLQAFRQNNSMRVYWTTCCI